jgi:hypothetical protein
MPGEYSTPEKILQVKYPSPKGRGLCLDSTATLHTEAGVQLWFLRPTHQGQLTTAPSSPSLAG